MAAVDNTKLRVLRHAFRRLRYGNAIEQARRIRDLCDAFLADPGIHPAGEAQAPARRERASRNRMESGGMDRAE